MSNQKYGNHTIAELREMERDATWVVLFKESGQLPWEISSFCGYDQAKKYYDRMSSNWADVLLCPVVEGPNDVKTSATINALPDLLDRIEELERERAQMVENLESLTRWDWCEGSEDLYEADDGELVYLEEVLDLFKSEDNPNE